MATASVRKRMTRKDGNAKATVKKSVNVTTSGSKTSVKASKKIVPNVRTVKGN